MDVIALHQAGFTGAVAPLGTALTEEQLEELWRLAPDPVLCFDGDVAGAKAVVRAAELSLPLLTPERGLQIATLPIESDPDTLILKQGASAFQAVLRAARPLSEALIHIVREQNPSRTAEQRAVLRARLNAIAGRIADRTVAKEFRDELNKQLFNSFRRNAKAVRSVNIVRTTATLDQTQAERGRCLVAILLRHPDLLRDTEEAFAALELSPAMSRLRDAVMHLSERDVLDSTTLLSQLNASGAMEEAAQALSSKPYPLPSCASVDAMPAEAEAGWWHIFGLMRRSHLDEEIAVAEQACKDHLDEATQRRLTALCRARDELFALDERED